MTFPATIESDIQTRISLVSGMIDDALTVTNSYLGTMGFFVNPATITAEQSHVVSGAPLPDINVPTPKKPVINNPDISEAKDYSSSFVMPDAGKVTDDSVVSSSFNYSEPTYKDWMLPEIRAKILDGFNNLAITVEVEEGIWNRLTQRLMAARASALSRRNTRWTGRGFRVSASDLAARSEEVNSNFGYAFADNARDKIIKRAELKDDNRKASIAAALKGEEAVIQRYEDVATRALDAAEAVVKLSIEAFKQNIGKYSDVTVEQYMNELFHFTENLKVKIAQSKADIERYITNTRIISERNKIKALEFEADAEAFSADAYFNEAKADVNSDYNDLAIHELEENLDLQLTAIKANMGNFLKKAEIQSEFAVRMGTVYAQYLHSALDSISVLLGAAKSDTKEVTAS